MKKILGLLQPDCTVVKIKDVVLKITSPYVFDSTTKIMLNVTTLENNVKSTRFKFWARSFA